MSNSVKILNVGRMSYIKSLTLQKHLASQHHNSTASADTIVLVEHDPVYTIGIRTKDYTHEDEVRLKETGNRVSCIMRLFLFFN